MTYVLAASIVRADARRKPILDERGRVIPLRHIVVGRRTHQEALDYCRPMIGDGEQLLQFVPVAVEATS
jgi:hypothetical protein